MRISPARLLLGVCLLCNEVALGQRTGIGLYFDQDLFQPLANQDRDYTMGVAVEFFEEKLQPLDGLAQGFAYLLDLHAAEARVHTSLMVGSVNFTPDDLGATTPVPGDRPYSSVLFLSAKRVVANDAQGQAIGVEAQAGLLGTYVAREVQKMLHGAYRDFTGSDVPVDPMGWHNQISAGGEPTLRLRAAVSRSLLAPSRYHDLAGTWDLSLGYQTNTSLGLSLRAGLIASPFWSLPYDPISRGNFVPAFGQDEVYVWAAYRTRLVGYDALLQGQFRESVLTYGSDEIRRLVHDGGVGLTGTLNDLQVTLASNFKTSELKRGAADRTHWWGGIYLALQF